MIAIKTVYASCRAYSVDMTIVEWEEECDFSIIFVFDRGGQNVVRQVRDFETLEEANEYFEKNLSAFKAQGLRIKEK